MKSEEQSSFQYATGRLNSGNIPKINSHVVFLDFLDFLLGPN